MLPPPSGSQRFTSDDWRGLGDHLHLSQRELQIVQGVFDDLKRECIALRLGISIGTVCTHFERLYRKLHVHSRGELMLHIVDEWHAMRTKWSQGEP